MNYKIINNNNNCYLNVILQLFLNNKYTKDLILYSNLLKINDDLINPSKILDLIKKNIDITKQNDAQEAFTFLIDKINFLNESCKGCILSNFKCHTCNHTRTKKEIFTTFNLYTSSMKESINNYLQSTEYYLECDNCKTTSKTTIDKKIIKIGNLLIFYNLLKLKINISTSINYNSNEYKLTGYIKHFGNFNYGHYIYYNIEKNLEFDDTTINKIEKHNLNDIYLIIYEKQ